MHGHNSKLDRANVVAVFASQDEADEAVLSLRIAGFRDRQIGYLARTFNGLVTDFVGSSYALLGSVLGLVAGGGIGIWIGQLALDGGATSFGPVVIPGPQGLMLTWAICGAIFGMVTGGMLGWGMPRGDTVHFGDEMAAGRYVVSVATTDRGAEARRIIGTHSGHNPVPADEIRLAPVM